MSGVTPWRTGTDRRRAPRVVDASLVERRDGDDKEDEDEHERHAWSVIVDASRAGVPQCRNAVVRFRWNERINIVKNIPLYHENISTVESVL